MIATLRFVHAARVLTTRTRLNRRWRTDMPGSLRGSIPLIRSIPG